MHGNRVCLSATVLVLACSLLAVAQQSADVTVPPMVNFGGMLRDGNGKALTGVVGVTFYLYKDQQGGAPLWIETQNVQPDKSGHYSVMLGSTTSQGLPPSLFSSGEARWLGVQAQGQTEQPRVLLLSVPYALKALDAETLGGKPASAFLTAPPLNLSPATIALQSNTIGNTPSTTLAVTGGGTTNFIPIWTSSTNLGSSTISEVSGTVNLKGTLQLPATGTATATKGFNSQPTDFIGSSFSSTLRVPVNQHFRLQAEPFGNNTSTPSGKMSLLYASGTGTPAETGFSIANNGRITFAPGQTFPGTGTITGVTAGTDLTGGGTTGNVTLNLNLGATDARYARLGAANTFTGNQIIFGNLSVDTTSFAAIQGVSTASYGVYGESDNDAKFQAATTGFEFGTTTENFGLWGYSASPAGAGVYGQSVTSSAEGAKPFVAGFAGVWGDSSSNLGVLGSSDSGEAVAGFNNTGLQPTAFFQNDSTNDFNPVFETSGPNAPSHGFCVIDAGGNLTCNGSKSAVVNVANGARKVALYAVEAPENWFEDFGFGTLAAGAATVSLEPTFAQTVNTATEYHVFLTAKGDCKGLYVANETPAGFEVHELGGGQSNVAFDYRIIARRKGYENIRLADMTTRFQKPLGPSGWGGRPRGATVRVPTPTPRGTKKVSPVRSVSTRLQN